MSISRRGPSCWRSARALIAKAVGRPAAARPVPGTSRAFRLAFSQRCHCCSSWPGGSIDDVVVTCSD